MSPGEISRRTLSDRPALWSPRSKPHASRCSASRLKSAAPIAPQPSTDATVRVVVVALSSGSRHGGPRADGDPGLALPRPPAADRLAGVSSSRCSSWPRSRASCDCIFASWPRQRRATGPRNGRAAAPGSGGAHVPLRALLALGGVAVADQDADARGDLPGLRRRQRRRCRGHRTGHGRKGHPRLTRATRATRVSCVTRATRLRRISSAACGQFSAFSPAWRSSPPQRHSRRAATVAAVEGRPDADGSADHHPPAA